MKWLYTNQTSTFKQSPRTMFVIICDYPSFSFPSSHDNLFSPPAISCDKIFPYYQYAQ